jgi:leucyl-tRNA synthetase
MGIEQTREREQRWQDEWNKAKLFEAVPKEGTPKFFCTFPYPYVNGLPHIGHLFTMMRVEAFARYKRHRGFNVLFPQAWHATGSPITTAAMRVTEGDAKQIGILKENGVPDHEIPLFKDPEHWIAYFSPRYKQDVSAVGLSIDWRREFITTSLNPQYDAFIRWQFTTLHEKGLVQQGRHPVVWCPKESAPVSDHARSVGEGETPQEFTLLKFPLDGEIGTFLIAATLRPETVYGQTNLWVGKDIEYVKARVKGPHGQETWIISAACAEKLLMQERAVEVIGKVKGSELLGKRAMAPAVDRTVPVLPSHFCSPDKGTGIVTSVPSDAPDDWMGLHDLQQPGAAEKEGIPLNIVADIKPIAIIKSSDLGDMAAVRICEDMGIKSQHDRAKLDEAKKVVYKKGFYEGTMLVGPYAGEPVQQAKDKMKKDMLDSGKAETFYELTGKVVCRCQTQSVVKIVSDQWFVTYGDAEWKRKTHHALDGVTLYPEKSRQQFEYVIDWLNDWACTREYGLGTRLPWDERWLIESLSDSTAYMAYYTIVHSIKDIDPKLLDRRFFDYVLLGKGTAPNMPGVDVEALRAEFMYWYPVDFRNSGKDLVQNHLTFFLFNHCAIFPEEHWPKGIGVNGWVTVNGQKMSKSLGNVIPVRKLTEEYGADATRMTILNGGEGMDDPNWDSNFAGNLHGKFETLLRSCEDVTGNTEETSTPVDSWLRSSMASSVQHITDAMEQTNFRTAIQLAFFEINHALKWYVVRTAGKQNKKLLRECLEAQLVMLAPFIPHVCEEGWRKLGNDGFVSVAPWPAVDTSALDPALDRREAMVRQVADDIQRQLEKSAAPASVQLFLAADWKREAYAAFDEATKTTRNPAEIMKLLSATPLAAHGPELQRLVTFLVKGGRQPQDVPSAVQEREWLESAREYLESIAGKKVEILEAGAAESPKAQNGLPGKPAVVLQK